MASLYDNNLKKKICEEICLNGSSTSKTAQGYNIPLKTLEKWITAYNKNPHCFDPNPDSNDFKMIDPPNQSVCYDDLSIDELKNLLMKKDIEISRLKKNYTVKGDGTDEKVFVIFSNVNTK